jgi:hypothetical protein
MLPSQPPYALEANRFRFPALAALAGRAPLGGARESVLAALFTARLAEHRLAGLQSAPAENRARIDAARTWVASMALPAEVRSAVGDAVAVLAGRGTGSPADSVRRVMRVTATHLDPGARSELEQIARALEAIVSLP